MEISGTQLVLLGRRGSGKSSCGNTILGKKQFQSILSTTPVTIKCEKKDTHVDRRHITVVDTPDFFGGFLTDPKADIESCKNMVRGGPCVYLLVLQLGRFTEGERKVVQQIQYAFGPQAIQSTIVLFSYGDDLEGVTIENFLRNSDADLKMLVERCGNRYHVFNNKDTSSDRQVRELLQTVDKILQRTEENSGTQKAGSKTARTSKEGMHLTRAVKNQEALKIQPPNTVMNSRDMSQSYNIQWVQSHESDTTGFCRDNRNLNKMPEDNKDKESKRQHNQPNGEHNKNLSHSRNTQIPTDLQREMPRGQRDVTTEKISRDDPNVRHRHDQKRPKDRELPVKRSSDDSVLPSKSLCHDSQAAAFRRTQSNRWPVFRSFRKSGTQLVLLGRRGSGKSSCGNTILGKKQFQSILSTTPVTIKCEKKDTRVDRRHITVVDTPDFFGGFLTDPKVDIESCKNMVRGGPCVYLLVLQLGRFTEGERKVVQQIQYAFGPQAIQSTIVLFSYGDDLEGVTIENFLRNSDTDLKMLVERCGNRYHVFNNKDTSSDRQVRELLQKVDEMMETGQKDTEGNVKRNNVWSSSGEAMRPSFNQDPSNSQQTHETSKSPAKKGGKNVLNQEKKAKKKSRCIIM